MSRSVLLWILVWLVLFAGLTWLIGQPIGSVTIRDTFAGESEIIREPFLPWSSAVKWGALVATAVVTFGFLVSAWLRSSREP